MQNPVPKFIFYYFLLLSIVFEKPGYLSEKVKTLPSLKYYRV